ncbi:hypothetical protein GCM10010521_23390 [Streptomyces rameus]|uniref:Uncharacterized protein n=1 Tax=Streptomyces rameus TaxID=68261 RepID=A0ABP6N9M3_9ACTN
MTAGTSPAKDAPDVLPPAAHPPEDDGGDMRARIRSVPSVGDDRAVGRSVPSVGDGRAVGRSRQEDAGFREDM